VQEWHKPGMGPGTSGYTGPNWECPKCKADVFGSKMACFKCQTPRPEGTGSAQEGAAEAEVATGGKFIIPPPPVCYV
jgi:hypothetical protein